MILFIDDDAIYIQDYLDELEELPEKYPVYHERSIDKAFEFIVKNSQDIKLLVLDMMIPSGILLKEKDNDNGRRTGKLFAEELKKEKDLKLFPIIFFTHVKVQNFQSEVVDISLENLQKEDFTPYLFSLKVKEILNSIKK
jgi:CheY-like chemotaxis protein